MIKKMSDMISNDKELFLEATKQAMKRKHGVEWADIETPPIYSNIATRPLLLSSLYVFG